MTNIIIDIKVTCAPNRKVLCEEKGDKIKSSSLERRLSYVSEYRNTYANIQIV